jgi:Fungal specific transcription factor domain
MWALAATMTDLYSDRCEALYQSSRRHLEEDELKNPGFETISLAPAQTWTLIAIYELNHGYFHRAWMSTSRAVRLIQMMRLHRLDGVTQVMDPMLRFVQAPPDLTDAEERRRIFWLTYIMDRSSCISMGFPALIDERDVCCYSLIVLELEADMQCSDSHTIARFERFLRKLDEGTMLVPFGRVDHKEQPRFIAVRCSGCHHLYLWVQACRDPTV